METLFPEMFPGLRAHATFASREAKMFLNVLRNILLPRQMFPCLHMPSKEANIVFASCSFAHPRNISGNNVSATMFPRLQGPLNHHLEMLHASGSSKKNKTPNAKQMKSGRTFLRLFCSGWF